MAKQTPEIIEMTEMLVLHSDGLRGSDADKAVKLEKIKARLQESGIDFVDQPEALEIWVGTESKQVVITLLQDMGYRTDVYTI